MERVKTLQRHSRPSRYTVCTDRYSTVQYNASMQLNELVRQRVREHAKIPYLQ